MRFTLDKFDTRKLTAKQGHEYGKGRATAPHRDKRNRRAKDKQRQELTW